MSEPASVTIVAVDDDEGHLELVRRNLRRAGVHNDITMLRSGGEALDYVFRRGSYQGLPPNEILMLLDINMPGSLDGVAVLRAVKENPDTKHIPIIMLTTTDDPREVRRCYELGCSVYVTKPVDPSAFIEAIRRLGLFVSIVKLPSNKEG